MNATDVERLVPHLSLPGCQPDTDGSNTSSTASSPPHRGRCIELLQHSGGRNASEAEAATACRGEADLCQRYNGGCKANDVTCKLMHKVRNYLRTHYSAKSGPPLSRKTTSMIPAIKVRSATITNEHFA
jgi:hypothetical protein